MPVPYESLIFVIPPSAGVDSPIVPTVDTVDYDFPGTRTEPPLQQGVTVADRIRRGSMFWHEISDPRRDGVVLDWIDNGYKLEWGDAGCAPAMVSDNHPSAYQEYAFVDAQIA